MEKDLSKIQKTIYLCNGTSCTNKGAEENITALRNALTENNLNDEVHTIRTKCSGFCKKGPIIGIQPENTWYQQMSEEKSVQVVTTHLLQNQFLDNHILYTSSAEINFNSSLKKKSFFSKLFNLFSFFILLFSGFNTSAQSKLSGVISDVNSHLYIPNVSVRIKETGQQIQSDENGVYEFKTIASGTHTLMVSHLGYEVYTTKVVIKENEIKKLTIALSSNCMSLDEIIVSTNANKKNENKLDRLSLQLQPVKSAQDLLRAVPGLFIAQHAGGGKAEQIFVRGTDNDHGTDFNIQMDGIPVNMPSHAHGQGYADMHFMIPETVGSANFYKGPYEAKLGDFSISGAAQFTSKHRLEKNIIKLESGAFNSHRALTMLRLLEQKHLVKKWNDNAYIASEYNYTDGFFENKLNFKRFNIFGKYNAHLSDKTVLSLSGSHFSSTWDASGQLPLRAIQAGWLSRYGSIDNSEGGITSRTNANFIMDTKLNENQSWKNQLYYTRNVFNLYSNFTFFLNDPINGDEILQWEKRDVFGIKSSYSRLDNMGEMALTSEIGLETRTDLLDRGRDHVLRRTLLSNEAINKIAITNYSLYIDETLQFSPKWNIKLGVRNEVFHFDLNDKIAADSSGQKTVYRFNPKAHLNFNASDRVSFFAKWGVGFHSNYSQAAVSKDANANNAVPQSTGADLGLKLKFSKKSIFSLTGWWLDTGSEYRFVSDDGSFENLGESRKFGFDASFTIQFSDYLWADSNINYAYSYLKDAPKNANLVPLHPRWNSNGGLTLKLDNGINASLRYRFMGERPATEDGSVYSKPYTITDLVVRYTRPKYEISLAAENLLNTKWDEAQFYDESQLKNETTPVMDFHNTPGTPFALRGSISYFL